MEDDLNQNGDPPPQGAASADAQRIEAGEVAPGTRGDMPAPRHLRRRPKFRGHIVVDDDEPLPVFSAPPDPPPAPPATPGSQVMQG